MRCIFFGPLWQASAAAPEIMWWRPWAAPLSLRFFCCSAGSAMKTGCWWLSAGPASMRARWRLWSFSGFPERPPCGWKILRRPTSSLSMNWAKRCSIKSRKQTKALWMRFMPSAILNILTLWHRMTISAVNMRVTRKREKTWDTKYWVLGWPFLCWPPLQSWPVRKP